MKKTLIIVISILLTAIAVFVVVSIFSKQNSNDSPIAETQKQNQGSDDIYHNNAGELVTIPGFEQIRIKNFYKDAKVVTDEGNVLFFDAGEYTFHYERGKNFFTIFIMEPPASDVRMAAERAFLEVLGIDETSACKLPVRLFVDIAADEKMSGINYGLSFCSRGKLF